jgi:hypothetical protein
MRTGRHRVGAGRGMEGGQSARAERVEAVGKNGRIH